jgi:hypothetical protein
MHLSPPGLRQCRGRQAAAVRSSKQPAYRGVQESLRAAQPVPDVNPGAGRPTILAIADRTKGQSWRSTNMSDAFDYFRAYAVRALCKARSMPHGRMKRLQLMAGRIYNLLKKEAAYSPNTQHLEDFRAAQKLERSLDNRTDVGPTVQGSFDSTRPQNTGWEAR